MIEKPTIVNFKEQVRQLKVQACRDAEELFLRRPVLVCTGLHPELRQLSQGELYQYILDCAKDNGNFSISYYILFPEKITVNNELGRLLTLRSKDLLHICVSKRFGSSVHINKLYGTPNSKLLRTDYEDNIVVFDCTRIDKFVRSIINIVDTAGIKEFQSATTTRDLLSTHTYYYCADGNKTGDIKLCDLSESLKNTLENFLKHGNSNYISDGCSANVCDSLL